MGRIRNIKPDYFKHEKIVDLPRDIRLFFVGLWTQCDVQGVFEWRPRFLKIEIFPCDGDITPDRIEAFLAALEVAGCVHWFMDGSKKYGIVHDFTSHQAISGKERKAGPKYPAPKPGPCQARSGTGLASSGTSLSALTKDEGHMTGDEGQQDAQGAPAPETPPPPISLDQVKKSNREALGKILRRKSMAYDEDAITETGDALQDKLGVRSIQDYVACVAWAVDARRGRAKAAGTDIGAIRYARHILFDIEAWRDCNPPRREQGAA